MRFGGKRGITLLCVMLAVGTAEAQTSEGSRVETDVRLLGVYTDNFYYDKGNDPKESASGGLVAPRLGYRGSRGKFDVAGLLEGEAATFSATGSTDDYLDGRALGQLSLLATQRSRIDVSAGVQRGHDPFGINRTEDATVRDEDLDVWHNALGSALFHYGTPAAVLNSEIGVSAQRRAYQTNEAVTRFLDYDSTAASYTIFYNYSPKTAALIDFQRVDVEMDEPFGPVDNRSGTEYRIRTGAKWVATGKTTGDARVGYYKREFDELTFGDEGFDWEASVQWAPRARTLLTLNTGRATQQSYRADTYANMARSASVSWAQYWTAKTSTTLRVNQTRTEFLGAGRDDRLYNAGLALDHRLTPVLSVMAGLDAFNRDSNDSSSRFNRFGSYFGIKLGR